METNTYEIWKPEEYKNPLKGEFIPNMVSYIHDENEDIRPAFRNDPKDYLTGEPNPSVALWPVLADQWLRSVYHTEATDQKTE